MYLFILAFAAMASFIMGFSINLTLTSKKSAGVSIGIWALEAVLAAILHEMMQISIVWTGSLLQLWH